MDILPALPVLFLIALRLGRIAEALERAYPRGDK